MRRAAGRARRARRPPDRAAWSGPSGDGAARRPRPPGRCRCRRCRRRRGRAGGSGGRLLARAGGLGLGLRLGLAVRLALGGGRLLAALLLAAVPPPGARVVGHVPAAALQLEARVRDEASDLALAPGAARQRRVGDALHLLEVPAVLAAVLVDRHRGPSNYA